MKSSRSVYAMLFLLVVGFFMDYFMDFVLSGESGFTVDPVPYYWLALLCQVVVGAAFLLLIYSAIRREWMTHNTAISFIVVGGLLLMWTPLWVSYNNLFPNAMLKVYENNPDFKLPAFWARSFFTLTSLMVVAVGVYSLLPKPKKRKK